MIEQNKTVRRAINALVGVCVAAPALIIIALAAKNRPPGPAAPEQAASVAPAIQTDLSAAAPAAADGDSPAVQDASAAAPGSQTVAAARVAAQPDPAAPVELESGAPVDLEPAAPAPDLASKG